MTQSNVVALTSSYGDLNAHHLEFKLINSCKIALEKGGRRSAPWIDDDPETLRLSGDSTIIVLLQPLMSQLLPLFPDYES